MQESSPTVKLNCGIDMPVLGLGTFKAEKGEVGAAVEAAVRAGYRLIDGAQGYGNENEIGVALNKLFDDKIVDRNGLFIVSKLFQTHHAWKGDGSRVREAVTKTLSDLQVEQLDLLLMHWPFAFEQKKLTFPLRLEDGSPNPELIVAMEYKDTWKEMEKLVNEGMVRAIGVSNFTCEQLGDLRTDCTIQPAVNQIELHPYLSQGPMRGYCKGAGIHIMGYSPLGSATPKNPERHGCTLLSHPVAGEVAEATGKSVAQVLIRWGIQHGCISIPKSSNAKRIAENADVISWSLTEENMEKLDDLNCDFRMFISYMKKPSNNLTWHDGVVGYQVIE